MSGVYSAVFTGVAVTAQQDFFEVNAPSDAVVQILEWGLSNSTDMGDAQEEGLAVTCVTGYTVSGSGGSAPTAQPREFGAVAFGGTVEANNTTVANTGTAAVHDSWNWNIRIPLQRIYTPDTTLWMPPSARWVLRLGTTPADSITMSGYVIFREIGG